MKEKSFFSRLFGLELSPRVATVRVETPPQETTLPNPYESLLTTVVTWLAVVQQESQPSPLQCKNAYMELDRLKRLGLENTATAQIYKADAERYSAHLETVDLIRTMRKVWQKLGAETLILKKEHFIEVLNRNNLVCGQIEDYVGIIPESAITSYEHAHKVARRGFMDFDSDIAYKWCGDGFPWIPQRQREHENKYNPFYIAAPRSCFRTVPIRTIHDPFIFSCPMGRDVVLIHAKWGAEAEDATIKRYEQLRDAIIGKGGVR